MYIVGGGQGKSRIVASSTLLALVEMGFEKVYLVFSNQWLLDRDRADFADWLVIGDLTEKVEYKVGLKDLPAKSENALLIFDEADEFIFQDPKTFMDLVGTHCSIGLTATDSGGLAQEEEILKVTGLKIYRAT